jgi:hypothetical protein
MGDGKMRENNSDDSGAASCLQQCRELHRPSLTLDRRRLLGWLGIGSAALLAGVGLPATGALAESGTEALLLNCIDYRLTGATTRYMDERGMAGKYDQFILAGAALGAKNDIFPGWGQTFWDHMQVAIDLHRIRQVIVMDHRDCGAYKVFLGHDFAADPQKELAVHAEHMRALRSDIVGRHSHLAVELLLMGLDGTVETIA